MKLNQIMCDGCGKVLRGKKGVVDIREPNLAIRGQITMFGEEGDYTHITSFSQEDICFCDTECFKRFCNHRLEVAEGKRKRELEREVRDDIVFKRKPHK